MQRNKESGTKDPDILCNTTSSKFFGNLNKEGML